MTRAGQAAGVIALLAAMLFGAAVIFGVDGVPPTDSEPGRSISLTFDDLPAQRLQGLPAERVARILPDLIDALVAAGAPAIGFVNEEKLFRDGALDPARVALLERWLDAGFELGNHTYSHRDLHRTSLSEYFDDILHGEEICRPLVAERGGRWRYFRHPMLHTGTDLATKEAVERFLSEHGYRVAPVTVDNSEWIFARAYDEALDRRDNGLAERVAAEYADYMRAIVVYYEGQSRALFDREIAQVLLLHANALNADHLSELIDGLAGRGYRFVDLDTALSDPAYRSPDRYVGPGGITWLHRWALTRDVDHSLFAGEPRTAEWVQELAGIRE